MNICNKKNTFLTKSAPYDNLIICYAQKDSPHMNATAHRTVAPNPSTPTVSHVWSSSSRPFLKNEKDHRKVVLYFLSFVSKKELGEKT